MGGHPLSEVESCAATWAAQVDPQQQQALRLGLDT